MNYGVAHDPSFFNFYVDLLTRPVPVTLPN